MLLEDALPIGIETIREKWATESLYYQNIGALCSCLPEEGKNCSSIETPLVHNLLSKAKRREEKGRGVDKNI